MELSVLLHSPEALRSLRTKRERPWDRHRIASDWIPYRIGRQLSGCRIDLIAGS